MPTSGLKALLKRRKISLAGCLERQDLINRLREQGDAPMAAVPATPDAVNRDVFSELSRMSVQELNALVKIHGVQAKVRGGCERSELLATVAECSLKCPICLCSPGIGDAAEAEPAWYCSKCLAPFHRSCAAGHSMSSALAARLPLVCPVPGCGCRWPRELVAWALSDDELRQYNTAVRQVKEMRSGSERSQQTAWSPRTKQAMDNLGVRPCPRCGSAVEKQHGDGFMHGCNKMTCRCGCKFCYACGLEADTSGVARCSCTGAHHSFLPHDSVMHNYSDMDFDPRTLNGLPGFLASRIGQANGVPIIAQHVQGLTHQMAANGGPQNFMHFFNQAAQGFATQHQGAQTWHM